MSKIALDKSKINPEHIEHLKNQFNEKTVSGAIYRLIEYYSITLQKDKETFIEKSNELIVIKNKMQQLKTYLKAKQTAELNINKLINN